MKTKAIIAALVTLVAAAVTYYIIKTGNRKKPVAVHRTHHLTEIFSKAKMHVK